MLSIIKPLKERKVAVIVIIVLTFLAYANSLKNQLVWDDHLFLEQWPQIQSLENIGEIIKGSAPPSQDKVFRPLRGLFYVIDYQFFGANLFFYHTQALLIHLCVTLLVYFIAQKIIKQRLGSFLVGLLFGLHPIHTETIDYISASMETIGTVLFFLSFLLYLKALPGIKKQSKAILYVTSIISATAAFFTYEMTLILPVLIILYDACFNGLKVKLKVLLIYVPYFLSAGIFLFIRIVVFNIFSRTDYLGFSFYLTMLTMFKVFIRYIFLLILPINQTIIHNLVGDFPSSMIPYDKLDPIINQTIFDQDVILSIAAISVLILIAIKYHKRYPIISFSIGWFFISLLPVSYIIPHGGAMAEKYLYIASFGFLVALVYLGNKFRNILKIKTVNTDNLVIFFVGLVILFYFVSTISRNTVWQGDITLFSDVVKKSPNNLLANYTLALYQANTNQLDLAALHYKNAIGKAPDFLEAHFNLGNIYLRQAKYDLADKEYESVLEINPSNTASKNILNNLMLLKSGTASAAISQAQVFVDYTAGSGLKFSFPVSWKLEEQGLTLTDDSNSFHIVLSEQKNDTNIYGTLLNQGSANIPNVDSAYVKEWSDKGIKKLEFYLFKNDKTLNILVYPGDSALMKEFDQILGSIIIN